MENSNNQKTLLRTFRSRYNLTWSGVAEALGVALSTVEAWHSERNPLPHTARIVLKIYLTHPALCREFGGLGVLGVAIKH